MNHVDGYVGIHFRDINKSNPNTYGNTIVRQELGKLGIGTYIIPNNDSYDTTEKTATVYSVAPDAETIQLLHQQEVELTESGLSVVRARINTPRALEEIIPVINGMKLRDIGASKWAQYELASEYMPHTVALEDGQEFTPELIEGLQGNTFVAKADKSQNTRDTDKIQIVSRSGIREAISKIRTDFVYRESESGKPLSNKRILLQEFMPGDEWPGLKATDELSREAMEHAESLELRVYCFVDRNRIRTVSDEHYATGITDVGLVSLDQTSVPQDAWHIARDVSTKLLDKAGVQSGYFSVDLIYGERPESDEDGIFVREINTRDPMMVELHENEEDAIAQRRLLASMMASVARRSL